MISFNIGNREKTLLLGILILFMVINYYLVYIVVKPFTSGFTVSGHPIFYMVPFAFSTYICFAIVLLSGLYYIINTSVRKKQIGFRSDFLLVAAAQTGIVVGAITLITGILWSYAEWGYFWQWEPRQTATLIMWLAYIALLIFRGMLEEQNPQRRALLTAIFGIVVSPSVLLSNYTVGPLHPEPQQTALGEGVGMILMSNFLVAGIITLILVYLTFITNEIEFKLKNIRMLKLDQM
ncbi:MAG: cytochrome c biogenesis protein CcsA [Candidatus Heimdallarchaeota archaeon]